MEIQNARSIKQQADEVTIKFVSVADAIKFFGKAVVVAKSKKRPQIGHKHGCRTINCLGCGDDWYSTDYR